jgi:exopolyphosphatase/guanosine-5'-triphosphate,3'-diphosphate pyrophosphatase
VLQGYRIPAAEAAEASAWIARRPPEQLSRTPGVSAARAATAPVAAVVLGRILDRLGPSEIAVSAFGLREGVYFELLPPPVRAQDPLIEACRRLERVQARFPGFGAELFAFLEPVLAGWGKRERRLARAACYLNDVNWRAHPEYRSVSCFETVTRANLAALDHADRVFLGLALAQRYGGGKRSVEADAALALLSGQDEKRAKALGRAMRLGAMIAASTPGALAEAALAPDAGRLTLRLGRDLAPLWGDVVEKRLAALAEAMDVAPEADIVDR